MKQRPQNWPKRVGTFLNNYRAVIFLAAAILLSSSAFSQVDTTKLLQYINAYGYRYKNGAFDSSFKVPADTFKLSYKDTSAMAIKNKVLYTWSGSNWKAVALKVNDTTFIINGDTVRVTTGGSGGSGTTDLTFSRNSTTVTVISSTGTDAVLPAATTTNAGVMTGANKLSLDSSITKRVVLNDSTTIYYNSQGIEVYRVVDSVVTFNRPLYAVDSRTVGINTDTALYNANQLQGRALSSTAPTTNQVIGWNGSSWVPMTQSGGGGTINLDTARSASTITIQPSGGGSVAILKLVDVGSNKAGIISPGMKTSWDSAWTKTAMLNDSIRVYYNSLGIIVHRDTAFSFSFVKSLEAQGTWGAQLKNDQETPGANKVYGTDGSGVKGWKADPAGGGGLSGLTTNRVPYATSSTTIADDAGLIYNPTSNELTTDSLKGKTIYGDSGVFVPQGRYDYDNSFWRPGIRFIGENKTGIARLSGITTFIDNGSKNIGIWREGAVTDVIFGYGANRLSVEATGSMNHVSLVGRMEFEGLGNGGYIDWVGYQAGSSLGRTIRITTDASSYGNSVVPIHFVPRNGFHAFRITDSANAVKSHFNYQGWLGIGNDTASTPLHIRSYSASDADGAVITLDGVNLSNQGIRARYWSGGSPVTIWEEIANFNTGEIKNFIKAGGGYFHTWYSNGSKSMTLNNSGNLSIGNTNNTYRLDVTGDINFSGALRVAGASGTTGQVLVSNGSSAPSWQAISSIYPWNQAGIDSANTTNATSTTVKTLTIPDASRGIIQVQMDCIGTDDGTKGLTGIKRVRYKKTGGTLTLGTIEDEMAIERDGGLTTATFTITTSSNNIIIQVTGEAATNLKWKPTYLMTNNAIAL